MSSCVSGRTLYHRDGANGTGKRATVAVGVERPGHNYAGSGGTAGWEQLVDDIRLAAGVRDSPNCQTDLHATLTPV